MTVPKADKVLWFLGRARIAAVKDLEQAMDQHRAGEVDEEMVCAAAEAARLIDQLCKQWAPHIVVNR